MPRATAPPARATRLQIRVSVDEHMADLYAWLLTMPATLRGRELVAQARLARALIATAAARAPCPPVVSALPTAPALHTRPVQQLAEFLGEQAAAQARSHLDLEFVGAIPPLA